MFHSLFQRGAGHAAVAQIFDEAWIAHREAAELGPRHCGLAQEAFDPAYQHDFLHRRVGAGLLPLVLREILGDIILHIPSGEVLKMRPLQPVDMWTMIVSVGEALKALANVVLLVNQIERAIAAEPTHDAIGIMRNQYETICAELIELERITRDLKLDATLHFVQYAQELLSRGALQVDDSLVVNKIDAERLEHALDSIRINFLVQMQSRLVFSIDNAHSKFLTSDAPPFGELVDDAFPSAAQEIADAANCLALGMWTACVLHLMRALEPALTALAKSVDVEPEQNWNKALNQIDAKLREVSRSRDGAEAEQWASETSAHFRTIKNAWRNYAVHGRARYNEGEAVAIFNNVSFLMQTLAGRLAE